MSDENRIGKEIAAAIAGMTPAARERVKQLARNLFTRMAAIAADRTRADHIVLETPTREYVICLDTVESRAQLLRSAYWLAVDVELNSQDPQDASAVVGRSMATVMLSRPLKA